MRTYRVVILLAGILVYANSLSGPFLWDDESSVVANPQIRQVWPLSTSLDPPLNTPVAGRPLANLTFALNYAAGGLDVTGYHVVNLTLHLLVALVLFAVVRRTLVLPGLADRFGSHAGPIACASALVWVLHPLNSEVVNYITERTESLMGLCYLLTLYCAIRAYERPHAARWSVAAVCACAAGMLSKESMVTAPIMVVLYDRVFLCASVREAVARRWRLYLGLAATWLVLAAVMLDAPREVVGLAAGDPWVYLLNQVDMIAHYLRLTVWPRGLVVDYGPPLPLTIRDVAWQGAVVSALGLATLVTLWVRPGVGFLLAWVFVTLAPTSSIVPIATEVGAERRMYLPLAALAVLAVAGVYVLCHRRRPAASVVPLSRVAVAGVTLVCVLLAVGTVLRNREYQSLMTIAETNVERRPHGRARFQLADRLVAAGQHGRAIAELQRATVDYPQAYFGVATEMLVSGRVDDAVDNAREFVRLLPASPAILPARDLLGQALLLKGDLDGAAEQFTILAQAQPSQPGPHVALGDVRLRQRRTNEAIDEYARALAIRPGDPAILQKGGLALGAAGRMREAAEAFAAASVVRPDDVSLLNLHGRALAAQGRYADALVPFRHLVELAPSDAQAAQNLAIMERLAAGQALPVP